MILPFGLLLACMAVLPLHWPEWWEKHYAKLALCCAAVTVAYYVFVLPAAAMQTVQHTAQDYAGFITLIGSLYIVSGGIHLHLGGEGRGAGWNTLFLAVGGLASNLLGTAGASMLLIRPWLQVNRSRIAAHHVVFFIFIVSNVGGCLTPMGDPPLLIGFLEGVPFWWIAQNCWPMWLVGMAFLLAVFYFIDQRHEARTLPSGSGIEFESLSWKLNLLFLAVIVVCVVIPLPPLLREGIIVAAAAASYYWTDRRVHEANEFRFRPIIEVGVLFFGIFATMMPALDRLRNVSGSLTPGRIYWSAGALSAFLDSAPAYLAFFSAVTGHGANALPTKLISALSVGTVMFGAVTYIGNAPNLMVKSMADHQRIPSPSFLAYLFKWAVPVMLPLLMLLWLIFFK
jgi:Na+/H+ antiporter NhaD/arsenite permease-like protein